MLLLTERSCLVAKLAGGTLLAFVFICLHCWSGERTFAACLCVLYWNEPFDCRLKFALIRP